MTEGSSFSTEVPSAMTEALTTPCSPLRELRTSSGHTVRICDREGVEAVELRDPREGLLLRFEPATGNAVICAPDGDLTLAAPKGHVDLVAGRGVRCLGRESVQLRAGTVGDDETSGAALCLEDLGLASISGETLALTGRRAQVNIGETTYVGKKLEATLDRARWAAGRVETVVGRLVERLESAHRTVEGLQKVTAGRIRTLARGSYQMKAGHASIKTEEELKLDGRKIYLG